MAALNPRQRAMEEELVNAAVMASPSWAAARTVLLYRSKPPELSVSSLGNAAFREGKRVVFPRVDGDRLVLHAVHGWGDLAPGAFGIMEPLPGCPVVAPSEVDLAIVPGVAFAQEGHRLGQGGGFYDRLLGDVRQSIGVAFDCQMGPVPVEPHDQPVGRVIHAGSLTE